MSVVVPQNPKDEAYAVNVSGAATWHGPWFDASLCASLTFNVSWSAVAATDGALSIEATNDPAQAAANVVTLLADNTLTNVQVNGTLTVSTTASKALITVTRPSHFVRVSYTRTAGGGANQFQVFVHGRST